MSGKNDPVALVQNPALGASLVWKFCRGFQAEKLGELTPMPSLFLVLPILLHESTLDEVRSTNLPSGLGKVVSKLANERERLLAVHDRALRLRDLTLQSIAMGVAANLLHLDYRSALIRANEVVAPSLPERLKIRFACAEKLGRWFARMPQGQVFTLLQVAI